MGKVALLLAGQGAQFPGMGKDLYENSSLARSIIDRVEELRPGTVTQLTDESFQGLNETKNTQICVYLMDYICGRLLLEGGVRPAYMAGFSLGELAALTLSGAMSLEDGVRLVMARGTYMQECAEKYPGGMAAVIRPDEDQIWQMAQEYGVYVANLSSAQQISVSGERDKIAAFEEALKEKNIRFVDVKVNGAFHTPYMNEAADKLRRVLDTIEFKKPSVTVFSNKDAAPYPVDSEGVRDMLQSQITHPVRFRATLENMRSEGADTFIECGPGHTLSGFVRKTLKGTASAQVSDCAQARDAIDKYRLRETAVVTGASRGIGRAAAVRLALDGYNVALVAAHDSENLKNALEEVKQSGHRAEAYVCDVSDPEQVQNTVKQITDDFEKITVLVNDAGVTGDGLLLSLEDSDIRKVMDVNLMGTIWMTRAMLPVFMKNRYGRIVNLSSVVGQSGNAGQTSYAASKAGISGFTRSVAKEYGRKNITCNAVAPGFIETDMTDAMTDEAKKAVLSRVSLRRMGKPEDVAGLIAFLAEPGSDYITGQVITIDGGLD